MNQTLHFLGVDVGSTTVKVVLCDAHRQILWKRYERHETQQAEKVHTLLQAVFQEFPALHSQAPGVFVTGSGATPLVDVLGATFVQEVNAVTLAVEHRHPDVSSVIELGGQDAKMVFFSKPGQSAVRRTQTSMNDKCASGTGATIDKCVIKVGMPMSDVAGLTFNPDKLHPVAAKCGVFAETDIVNLVKSGIPAAEIMCSLADAIVNQNLSVLTRGNILEPRVLLLGGPNCYLPFLRDCWRYRLPQAWRERGFHYPDDEPLDKLIFAPDNAEYYAAYGAVLFGAQEHTNAGFKGLPELRRFIEVGRQANLQCKSGPALTESVEDQQRFIQRYQPQPFKSPTLIKRVISGYLGLDGGSTSSKCVLVDPQGRLIRKVYQLSRGNPLEDMKQMFSDLQNWADQERRELDIRGFGVTGYAAEVMDSALLADANIVETVAHMKSAQHFFPDVDVVCDVGGQDIKVLFMQQGNIRNFKLSNSCSAGNGMLLQAMADQFGLPVTDYAKHAFNATLSPVFSYGCAVFLDSDRINFQKEGYNREELLAGLALVLPKNIWQYVVQIPRMAELGRIFVLQGGTQYNLAAVKAQVDYIQARVPDAQVHVHPHAGEAGALGAAFEAQRVVERRGYSRFAGLQRSIALHYSSRNDESTRCDFCANNCSRTFIDTKPAEGQLARYISGFSCEKGTVEDHAALRKLNRSRKSRMARFPNLVQFEASLCFRSFYTPDPIPDADSLLDDYLVTRTWLGGVRRKPIARGFERSDETAAAFRQSVRIGIPKALNIWSTGPLWRTYFETLGLKSRNIVFSDDTSEELSAAGSKYGSVDPCFPAKVAQAHIHNLLFTHHARNPLNYVFFPAITHIPTFVRDTMDTACCPIVAGTPKVMRASFTKQTDFFAQRNITYLDPAVTLNEPLMLKRALFETFGELLKITEDESDFAVDQGFTALRRFDETMQEKGRQLLDEVETDNRVALLMIGRPYHNDPGLNHTILEEYQAMGYPILSMRSIPKDPDYLRRFFADDLRLQHVKHPLQIDDVWPENYSVNSVQKVWAAKFAARHPNVAVLDLSSFKCGHDAPTYGLIDRVIGASDTPYSTFHDIDANRPAGSIKIRTKTFGYTLTLAAERLQDQAVAKLELKRDLLTKERLLLQAAPPHLRQNLELHQRLARLDAELNALDSTANQYDQAACRSISA